METAEKQGEAVKFECDLCPRSFSNSLYLQLHQEIHPKQETANYQCPNCDLRFLAKIKLDYHLFEKHYTDIHEERNVKDDTICVYCSSKFSTKLDMVLHKVDCKHREDEKATYNCDICGEKFDAERFLSNHSRTCAPVETKEVGGGTWTCDVIDCQREFSKFINFKNHLFTHTEYPFICTVAGCESRFTVKNNLTSHAQAVHGRDPTFFKCVSCSQEFSLEEHLNVHVEQSHEEEEMDVSVCDELLGQSFSCEDSSSAEICQCKMKDCWQRFESTGELRAHYISHNQVLRKCGKCNMSFSEREEMYEHALEEHGLKLREISCPFCIESFPLKKQLRFHLLARHPKPWRCEQCQVEVSSVSVAKAHKERHSSKQCDVCSEVLQGSKRLLKHLLTHNVDIYSCPVQSCSVYFGELKTLKTHLLTHQKDKIFLCTFCKVKFYNMRQLECHLDSSHVRNPLPHEFTSDVNLVCSYPKCKSTFVQEKWLFKHRKLIHPGWDSDTEEQIDCDDQGTSTKNQSDDAQPVVATKTTNKSNELKDNGKEALNRQSKEKKVNKENDASIKSGSTGKLNQNLKRKVLRENSIGPSSKTSKGLAVQVNSSSNEAPRVKQSKQDGPVSGPDRKSKLLDMETDDVDCSEKEFEFVNLSNSVSGLKAASVVKVHNVDSIDGAQDQSNKVPHTDVKDCNILEVQLQNKPSTSERRESGQSDKLPPKKTKNSTLGGVDDVQIPGYLEVISQRNCPEVGDFVREFGITSQHILDLTIPEQLKSDAKNIVVKGLAIDLLHLSTTSDLPNTAISRYFHALLPEWLRPNPAELSEEGSNNLVNRIVKIRIQASRFRARYKQFSKYLDNFLLEEFNPFVQDSS